MKIKVKWENLDQESKDTKKSSHAKISKLTIGTKALTSPSKGIKILKTSSDFLLWNEVTNNLLPPKGIGLMRMDMKPKTMKNLMVSNGKFNGKVSEFTSALGKIDNKVIKMIYPRITLKDSKKIPIKEESIRASLHFLNSVKGNDANILPLPPVRKSVQKFDTVIKKGIVDAYSIFSEPKPLIGYIPHFDNPQLAVALVEKYVNLEQDVRFFVVDFARAKRDRNMFEIINKLNRLHKGKETDDFYIHAVNVPPDYDNQSPATPFYDLLTPLEGVDSINNNLLQSFPKAPPKGARERDDLKKSKTVSVASQFGSFDYRNFKEKKLLGEKCRCSVCNNGPVSNIYDETDLNMFYKKKTVHRMFLDRVELEEYQKIIKEKNSVLDYLQTKPMAGAQRNLIIKSL